MFGIGLPEMIVILVVALVVVGPDKLPELARSLAKGINELRSTMNQLKENFSEETKVISSVQEDLKKTAGQISTELQKEESKIWHEDDIVQEAADSNEDTDNLALQEELPWEKDANTPPKQDSSETTDSKVNNQVTAEDTPGVPETETQAQEQSKLPSSAP